MTETTNQFPVLYHKGSKGAIYSWRIWTEGADIVTEYGQLDGKMQVARKTAVPKNVGKTNESTPEEQAESEAQSMWTFKVERKYRESLEDAEEEEIFLPMLAVPFEKRKGKKSQGHTYPCDVQPKLDGVRCLAFWEGEEVKLISRGGKYWDLPHISESLTQLPLPRNVVLDGELYLHGANFQQITRLVKKNRENTHTISLHVYDCVLLDDREALWPVRKTWLDNFQGFHAKDAKISLLQTQTASDEDEIMALHASYVSDGYEGAIVRCYDESAYRFSYRSKRLMKVKCFDDAEFEVVGYKTGVGKFAGCVIWKCVTEAGNEFDVTFKGTMEQRRALLEVADSHVGQQLKVAFQGRSESGIPRFPVGLGIRLEEDL